MSLEQETAKYYNYLLRIERVEFEQELLEIISRIASITTQLWNNPMIIIGVYTGVLHTRQAAQIIAKCEERLIKAGTRNSPFTVDKIHGGALKGLLIPSDYSALMVGMYHILNINNS